MTRTLLLSGGCLRLLALVCCLLAAGRLSAQGRETRFDDVGITAEPDPPGEHSHGYCEYVLWVRNHSETRSHRVTLILPAYSYSYETYSLREVTRTVEVGPDAVARVPLWLPTVPMASGRDVSVVVDGDKQETIFPLRVVGPRGSLYGRGGATPLLVLTSNGIKPDFAVRVGGITGFGGGGAAGMGGGMMGGAGIAPMAPAVPPGGMPPGGMPPGGPGGAPAPPGAGGPEWEFPPAGGGAPPAMAPVMPRITATVSVVGSPLPMTRWTTAWLGLSRYDGIVITGDELRASPPSVQTALWQYVECGGCLLVLGQASLPDTWQPHTGKDKHFPTYRAGFGTCLVSARADYDRWDVGRWNEVVMGWEQTAAPWRKARTQAEANNELPVLTSMGIPVRGLFILMIVFTIVIGPVNVMLLSRRRRRIWLLWTVPVISLATCLAVFGYMLIAEGWRGQWRSETLTVLDQGSHRATTIGWTAYYSPLTPRDGLHFSADTELSMQCFEDYRYRRRRSSTPCSVDWTGDQHLGRGWVSARVPSHFMVRKSEAQRKRVDIARGKDGALEMVNSLGVPIRRLWYADDKGQIYTAEEVAAGGRAALKVSGARVNVEKIEPMRNVYSGEWLAAFRRMTATPEAYLHPGTYLAEAEGAPFLEEGLAKTRTQKCHSLVLGILHEKDNED